MTAIIRSHPEAVTAEPGRRAGDILSAFAAGLIGREQAIRQTGVRDYAELLVALGDAGLAPRRPPPHDVENEAVTFARIWRST